MRRLALLVLMFVALAVSAAAQTDIDVLYIQKTPLLNFDSTNGGWPTVGSTVTWNAKVKNWASTTIPTVVCEWWLNGVKVQTDTLTNLTAGETRNVTYNWSWLQSANTLEFRADTTGLVQEVSEQNNNYSIMTNAITYGGWIEQSLYDHFHAHQIELGDGANSYEDWCYRMVKRWNELFSLSVWPSAPDGVVDRIRVEKIVVVPDGTLPQPYPTNWPANDHTVDLMWGHPYYVADIQPGAFWGVRTNGPFFIDYGEIHELDHARYVVDHYGFDVSQDATTPNVLVTDKNGNLVAGTAAMPFAAWNVVYYNKSNDIMGGSSHFGEYAAGAWNRKMGIRGPRGNQNSPGDIGVYMQDLPQNNWLQFTDNTGAPLVGATINIYRAVGGSGWYAKTFDNTADITATTDANGRINVGRCPFSSTGTVTSTYGLSNATFIIKVSKDGSEYFTFGEISDFNIEYWKGNTQNAYYPVFVPWGATNLNTPIGANQWRQELYNNSSLTGLTDVKAIDPNNLGGFVIRPSDQPLSSGVGRNSFSEKLIRNAFFNKGTYKFYMQSDDGGRLFVDGTKYIDNWAWDGQVPKKAEVTFTSSALRMVQMDHADAGGPAIAALSIIPPKNTVPGPDDWKMEIYNSANFTNLIEVSACPKSNGEGFSLNWGDRGPGPTANTDGFSVRFTRSVSLAGGIYRFTTTSDDGVRFFVDGVKYIDHWTAHQAADDSADVTLAPGNHTVVVETYDASGPAQIALTAEYIAPDFDVAYISRTPRYDRYSVSYDVSVDPNEPETGKPSLSASEQAKQRWPNPGETVTYTAHVKNIGIAPASCGYKWYFDGVEVASGALSTVDPGGETTASYSRPWDSETVAHKIKFVADPDGLIGETYENNNSLEDATNALSYRLHVWQSLYNWFDSNAKTYADIASFDDWAQQTIRNMNRLMSEATYPGTPQGIPERVRIDEIVVEPDSTVDPDPTGTHAPVDISWDGRQGFTNTYLANQGNGKNYFESNPGFLTGYDPAVVRALSLELGLVNLDSLSIAKTANAVASGFGHVTSLEKAAITTGGPYFSEHEAYALLSNLHKRRGYAGEYLYDLPQVIKLRVMDSYLRPLAGANVKIYQEYPGKTVPATMRFDLTSDANGYVTLPARSCFGEITTATGHTLRDNPFGIVNTKGENGVFFAKVTSGSSIDYQFIEITQMNIAKWLGYSDEYTYTLQTNIISPKATTSDLNNVCMYSPTFGFAVGASGKILKYDGTTWSSMTSGTTQSMLAVDISPDGSTAIAVGNGGTVLVYSGSTWVKKTFPVFNTVFSCAAVSNSTFVVGGSALSGGAYDEMYRTTDSGTTWTKLTVVPSAQGPVKSIRFFDSLHGILVAPVPPAYYTEDGGVTWTAATGAEPAVSQFYDCAMPALDQGWAVNTQGSIYTSATGGSSWTKYADFGTSEPWYGVDMWAGGSGWAGGPANTTFGTPVIKRFEAGRWFNWPVTPGNTVNDIWLTSAGDGWAVGKAGLVLKLGNPAVSFIPCNSVAAVKTLPNGAQVSLSGKIVTAVLGDSIYIEEADRFSGIRVFTNTTVAEGDEVTVSGRITTSDGETSVIAGSVTIQKHDQTVPAPLAVGNINLGGSAMGIQAGVSQWTGSGSGSGARALQAGLGLNNVGLLVRCWGSVTSIGSGFFYISDGSAIDDGDPTAAGIRVAFPCPADIHIGDPVAVTGLSSCITRDGNVFRLLRPRRAGDITAF